MDDPLQQPVTALKSIGPSVAKRLEGLGVRTIQDLLWHLPFRYEDFRIVTPIAELRIGQSVTVHATVDFIANRRSPRRRMHLTEALVRDESGSLQVIWFNQPFLAKTIKPGDHLMLSGTLQSRVGRLQLASPAYERIADLAVRRDRLAPVYPTTAGLTQKQLRFFISLALRHATTVPDALPAHLRKEHRLPDMRQTLWYVHFPKDEQERETGLRRLKFDELLAFHLGRRMNERGAPRPAGPVIPFSADVVKAFIARLPFALTPAQKRAAWDILQDVEKSEAMNRLLEGDVGSGKTVVAAMAMLNALHHGFTAAYLAPTEILAQQHARTFASLFAEYDFPVVLWTHGFHHLARSGAMRPATRKRLTTLVAAGKPFLLVGTHAILEEDVRPTNLGIVVVDEQHRFSVAQRQLLHEKGRAADRLPHFLSLTATPIPRTLALSLAGDLKISIIRQLPKGRKPVATQLIVSERRVQLYRREVEAQLAAGRQAFVLAPHIETSEKLETASVLDLHRELAALLPHRKIGLLHGKLPSVEKESVLAAFVQKKLDALVSTTVIEVGIDVPNATVMVIEGAERFGLAQLHQLRGRVGRGEHQSFCYLLPTMITPLVRRRLEAVCRTTDGFSLAELDLELRGPGDLVGLEQSGFLDFRFATLGDHVLMQQTARLAERLLKEDAELKRYSGLRIAAQCEFASHRE